MTATAGLSQPLQGLPTGSGRAVDLAARDRFVAGPHLRDAAIAVRRLHATGITATVGRFAPIAEDETVAVGNAGQYNVLAAGLHDLPAGTHLEVDLPHLGLQVSPGLCVDLVQEIAGRLPEYGRLQFGAEDSTCTDEVLDVAVAAHRRGIPVRATLQANLHRSAGDLEWLIAEEVPVRLVKGGFTEPAQIAYTGTADIDDAIRQLAGRALAGGLEFSLATHDSELHAWSRSLSPIPALEMLFGVLPQVAHRQAFGREVRVYVPFGADGQSYIAKRVSDEAAALRASLRAYRSNDREEAS